MSTAILYSGQARTIARCHPTQWWHIHRRFSDPHIFVVWQKDANAEAGVHLLKNRYGKDRVFAKLIDDPLDLPMIPLSYGEFAPYANAAPHQNLMMQHWYQEEVWKFYKAQNLDFPTVIRQRGDNFFHSFDPNYAMLMHWRDGENVRYGVDPTIPVSANVCFTPWWGRFGGHQDRFAIMGPAAAAAYFTIYSHIQDLLNAGCPFHPESLLKARLESAGVRVLETLRAEHSTLRADGQIRQPEIMAMDLRDFNDL